jgi:UDPglucose 6-dehydrogenase
MIKYASNALQATLISFSNEFANLCSAVGGVDIVDVMQGVNLSRLLTPPGADGERIWPGITRYLAAGCGFGGSCFPKDLKALAAYGDRIGNEMAIAEAVLAVNAHQPTRLNDLADAALGGVRGRRVTVLGLAFKPGTDDMRESPAIPVVQGLLASGSTVRVFDPVATEAARAVLGDGPEYARDLESAVDGAEAIIVVTSWDEFHRLPELVAKVDPPPVVVDGRRMLDPDTIERYLGVGR